MPGLQHHQELFDMPANRKAPGLWLVLLLAVSSVAAGREPSAKNTSATQDKASQGFKTTFIYKRIANADIKADVYRPRETGLRPVIVWIHGGALIFGSRSMLPADELGVFLEAGYLVVAIDYRLAPETKLPEILKDVDDALHWVRTEGPHLFNADPARIAVVGQSAGAYLALMEGVRATPRVQAIVSFYGYGNISGEWYSRPDAVFLKQPLVTKEEAYRVVGGPVLTESSPEQRIAFYVFCRQTGRWPLEVASVDPHLNPQDFAPYNPEGLVTASYPPTFLLHGDRDTEVPFLMSLRMADSLKRHGVEYRFYRMKGFNHLFDVYPDALPPEGHAIGLRNQQVKLAFDEVMIFLKRRIGS
jgi:acetyl esterase/lipase